MRYPAQSDIWRLNQATKLRTKISTNGQSRILAHHKQVFPLSLFPDELIIEEMRVVHIKVNGPFSKGVISIMATDIACVNASTGIFFGIIHIQSLTGGPEIMIDNMFNTDVFGSRDLVEGIAMSAREGLANEEQADLAQKREDLLNAGRIRK